MLAVAQHLKGLGHNITFNASEKFRNHAEAAGIRFVAAVGKANFDEGRLRDAREQKNQPGDDHKLHMVRTVLLETIPDQHRGIQEILSETPTDLIVTDTMFFGAFPMLLGPREKRPPVISCGVNPLMLTSRDCGLTSPPDSTPQGKRRILEENEQVRTQFRPIAEDMKRMMHACGAPPLPHFFLDGMYILPDVFLQFTAEAFEFPRSDMPDTIRFAGPLLPRRSVKFEEPAWWSELDGSRPVVLVTQGTLANGDFNELIQPALSGLSGEELMVIAAAGRSDTQAIAAPANARVAAFIPFDRLLPKVDVFITNGGYGAVNHALSLGVPIVVAGDTEDKDYVAARVAWTGAGINLKTRYASPEQIRTAVRAILMNKQYKHEAQRLQADFAGYDAKANLANAVDPILTKTQAPDLLPSR
jgi:MGT family glycosyltransferase